MKIYSGVIYFLVLSILLLRVGLVFIVNRFLRFYIVFEISLIPILFFIIVGGGRFDRLEAGGYLLLYTLVVSFPLMINVFFMGEGGGRIFIYFSLGRDS